MLPVAGKAVATFRTSAIKTYRLLLWKSVEQERLFLMKRSTFAPLWNGQDVTLMQAVLVMRKIAVALLTQCCILAGMEARNEPPPGRSGVADLRHHEEDPGQEDTGSDGEGQPGDASHANRHDGAEPGDTAAAEHAGKGSEEQGEKPTACWNREESHRQIADQTVLAKA
jgi:hypothetical protein